MSTSPVAVELAPPAPPRGWPRERVIGYLLVGLWILACIGMLAYLAAVWNPAWFEIYIPPFISGL